MLFNTNPLLDKDFLTELNAKREREVYAKIIALTFQEEPIELIEGQVTQGSINIDGASALRRTCSLTLVAKELNINDYYWGLKSKFKLEIGIKNTIKNIVCGFNELNEEIKWGDKYPQDIIWFPQGIYAITGFNTSQSTNNYTITISGKDKMCFLNGDLGGNLTASIDFGTEEFYDKNTNTTTYTQIPIETIIKEAVHTYALEPYHNIIINDLDEAAVELLEYRGDTPLYLLRNVETDEFDNYTDNGNVQVYFSNSTPDQAFAISNLVDQKGYYDPRVELAPNAQTPSELKFIGDPNSTYTVAKIEYGQTVGYRQTDLTYAGELISNIGESITSILDKIKNMLGDYEYFYDLDGRFIFQKKKTYIQTAWNNIVKIGDEEYVENAAHSSAVVYRFDDSSLITSFQNSPNLSNLKNDYSVWGQRDSVSGEKLPIHYRYAIDIKPVKYKTLTITNEDIRGYNSEHLDSQLEAQTSTLYTYPEVDWRELIYQMALDYYKYNQLDCYTSRLIEANPDTCFKGVTGYEQYYIDLQGFWRQLYDSNPKPYYVNYNKEDVVFEYIPEDSEATALFIKGKYIEVTDTSEYNAKEILALINVNGRYEFANWLDAIKIDFLNNSSKYYIAGPNIEVNGETQPTYVAVTSDIKDTVDKAELFVLESDGTYKSLITSSKNRNGIIALYYYENDEEYYDITTLPSNLQKLFFNNNKYERFLYATPLDKNGNPINETSAKETVINYYEERYDYILDTTSKYCYWTKDLINAPAQLNFWFDFLDANSELGQFSVQAVGDRVKAVNDTSVTAIYFRQVPNLVFTTYKNYLKSDLRDKTGYTPVFITGNLENMFNISAQGKSAQDKIDELLYNHSYCIESVTIQAVPIYHIQPNTRIFIKDDASKIDGEYIVSKITIPLSYNGTMSITATKAPERLY